MRKPTKWPQLFKLLSTCYCADFIVIRSWSLPVLFCVVLSYCHAQSATPVVVSSTDAVELSTHFDYLPAASNKEFSWPSFREYQRYSLSSYTNKISEQELNWFVVGLSNQLPSQEMLSEWVLHFPLLLTDIEYVLIADGQVQASGRSGAFTPVADRTFNPTARLNYGKISFPAASEASLYIGARMERLTTELDYRVQLIPVAKFYQARTNEQLFNGVFIGFMLLMLLYNLFLYMQVKDQTFVYYSAYLLGLLVFGLYNTGNLTDFASDWFFVDHPQFLFFFKLSTYLGIFAYLVFLRGFLNLSQLFPTWDNVFKWLGWLAFPVMLIDAIVMYRSNFNYASADVFTLGYTIFFLALVFPFLIPLWGEQAGGKKRFFIIAGVAAMGIGILITVIQRIQFVEYSSLYFRLGTIIEVVIFSLGLAYRQRENQLEQQAAVFALEKAKILQEQKELEAQKLAELDEAKNRFYTHITHEFRTPLTVIMGLTQHLDDHSWKQDLPGDKRQDLTHSLSLINRNSKQLLVQVNQLLDLAKLESGAMPLNFIQSDVVAFLEYLTESFHSLAEEKKVRLLFYAEERQIVMDFDETKLQYIVYNLLSNAVKFSLEGGKIILHSKLIEQEQKAYLQLKVSDTGKGIPTELQSRVFDRFYQVTNQKDSGQGTGVGLTLTKELVELMNGEIYLESKLEEGTVFTILLPISNDAEMVTPKEIVPTIIESPLEVAAEDNGITAEEAAVNNAERDILLVVEDNKDIIQFLKKLLSASYQIEVAGNGRIGIKMAFELIPDIILSDVMMPEITGLELTSTLKKDERTSHIPIILLTAKANEIDKMAGLREGADAYLLKPFNKEELLLRLENLLNLRRSVRKQYQDENTGLNTELPIENWADISVDELFLKKLKQAVIAHLSETAFSTADLSKAVNLSQSQLYRKLKAVTGETPSNFIRNIRLNHSLKLLKKPELNISEIAYLCGFNDPNYFSRAFHKLYGKSPTHFRD